VKTFGYYLKHLFFLLCGGGFFLLLIYAVGHTIDDKRFTLSADKLAFFRPDKKTVPKIKKTVPKAPKARRKKPRTTPKRTSAFRPAPTPTRPAPQPKKSKISKPLPPKPTVPTPAVVSKPAPPKISKKKLLQVTSGEITNIQPKAYTKFLVEEIKHIETNLTADTLLPIFTNQKTASVIQTNFEVIDNLIEIAEKQKTNEAVKTAISLLSKENPIQRMMGVEILSMVGTATARKHLENALEDEPLLDVKREIVLALRKINSTQFQ